MNTAFVNPWSKEDVLAILAQNLGQRGSVWPLPTGYLTSWAKGLNLPRGGPVVLYTGHMYQMIPVLKHMAKQRKGLSPELTGRLTKWVKRVNRLVNFGLFSTLGVPAVEKARYVACLRNIVALLRQIGINPGYLYEAEKYAGALAFDLGLEDVFYRHAQRVTKRLRRLGVEKIITVDPHTTHILREVYPQVVQGFDFEVQSYLEVLAEALPKGALAEVPYPLKGRVVWHDSCVYARHLGITEEPRVLLKKSGLTLADPRYARQATYCCGGPIESLFPEKAAELAQKRLEQLVPYAETIVCACPICLLNLSEANPDPRVRVLDMSEVLALAFGPRDQTPSP